MYEFCALRLCLNKKINKWSNVSYNPWIAIFMAFIMKDSKKEMKNRGSFFFRSLLSNEALPVYALLRFYGLSRYNRKKESSKVDIK